MLADGWFRVELAWVSVAPEELRELREHDVVLADLVARPEHGTLVLSSGARFSVALSVEDGQWMASVGARRFESTPHEFAVNLAHRVCDARELPGEGARISLAVTPEAPLVLTWRDDVVGLGAFVRIEDEPGVRINSLRRT